METVVIEIRADYRDNTKGMGKSVEGMDRLSRSIDRTKQQLDKASSSTDNWYQKLKRFAGKVISIPIKVVDYATKPIRSLFNLATSLRGVLSAMYLKVGFDKLVSSPLNLADQYSSAKIGFETLFQSAEKAQKMMDEIDQFAIKTPFNTSNVISNIQKMMAYGWDATRMLKDMEIIGNAAAATGKGDQGLESIVYALSEIRSKGKLSTQELNQLASAGIKAKQYLAEGLGFGSDDAGMAKLAKALEKGEVGANQAIDLILEGMKEFDGMMDKTANETVSGLKSQLADLFEVNIARRWGQGLQDGAKRGLGTIAAFLDENRGKLEEFGEQLYDIGVTLSNWLADKAETAINKLMEITNSTEFKNANLGGKFKIVWKEIISDPFNEWWNGEGGAKFRQKAEEIGTTVGEWIGNGLSKAFNQIIPNLFSSASKVLPGGEKADGSALLSAGILAYGAKSLGLGKLAGWGLNKLASHGTAAAVANGTAAAGTAAAGTAGVASTGLLSVGGYALGGLGLVSAINDLASASKAQLKQNKNEYLAKGLTKGGMVALGAAIGTAIAPGIGTALGAGIGGLGALFAGGPIGTWISGLSSGYNEIKAMADAAVAATENLQAATTEAEEYRTLFEEYKNMNAVISIIEAPESVKKETLKEITTELKEIKDKRAEIEAKLKSGSLTQEQLSTYKEQYDGLKSKEVVLTALLSEDGLTENDLKTIETRISELDGKKIELTAGLADPKADREKIKREIGQIELEQATLRAVASENDINLIADTIAKLDDEALKLKAELAEAQEKGIQADITAIKQDIETNEQNKMLLEAKILGLSDEETEAYVARIKEISGALSEASGGLISQWELQNGELDETLAKLKQIQEIKDKEAEIEWFELQQTVFDGRSKALETAVELEKIKKQQEETLQARNELYSDGSLTEAYELSSKYQIKGVENEQDGVKGLNSYNLTAEDMQKAAADFHALSKKYPELYKYKVYLQSDGTYDWNNPEWLEEMLWGATSEYSKKADELRQKNEELAAEYEKYYSPLLAQYTAEKKLITDDKSTYGGTMNDLIMGTAKGEVESLNALMRMINDIKALEESTTFKGIEAQDQFNPATIMESLTKSIPDWIAAAFAGQTKVEGNDIASAIYNAFVEKGNPNGVPKDYSGNLFHKDAKTGEYTSVVTAEEASKWHEEGKEAAIKGLQEALMQLGYELKDGADGSYGPETKEQHEKFIDDYTKSGKKPEEFMSALTEAASGLALAFKEALFGKENTTDSSVKLPDTNPAAEGVRKWMDAADSFASETENVTGVTTSMASGFETAGTNAGTLSANMCVLDSNTGSTAGSVTNLGEKSGTSSGFVNLLGSASGDSAGLIGDLGSNASAAAGSMLNASSNGLDASENLNRLSTSASTAANALSGIRSFSFPSIGGLFGSLFGTPTVTAKAEGDILTGPEFILAGEDGDEAIIPLSAKHRRRGLGLLKEAARRMGIPMMAKGGVIGNGSEGSENAPRSVSAGGITVSLGGMHFTIQGGSGDSESIINAIKSNMPSVANEVANAIAAALEQTYSNMATKGV